MSLELMSASLRFRQKRSDQSRVGVTLRPLHDTKPTPAFAGVVGSDEDTSRGWTQMRPFAARRL